MVVITPPKPAEGFGPGNPLSWELTAKFLYDLILNLRPGVLPLREGKPTILRLPNGH